MLVVVNTEVGVHGASLDSGNVTTLLAFSFGAALADETASALGCSASDKWMVLSATRLEPDDKICVASSNVKSKIAATLMVSVKSLCSNASRLSGVT